MILGLWCSPFPSEPSVAHPERRRTAPTGKGGPCFLLVSLERKKAIALVETETFSPNELKIDIEINNYPYAGAETELPLLTEIDRELESTIEEVEVTFDEDAGLTIDERGINIISGDETIFFTFKETAVVDGVEEAVGVTQLENDRFSLVYPRGDQIVHDPKVGDTAASGDIVDLQVA